MRRLRKLSMAAVLTLALGTCAFADVGIIGTPPAPQPLPPVQVNGIIGTPPGDVQCPATPDPTVEVALFLVQSVLSVL
jgi:hypothetical protein